MGMIRWLHISDLHICEQADWKNYKKELFEKCKEIGKIDFVIVTGDYHDFKDKNDFQVTENFLKNFVSDELGLDISRDLFMVPGNHDGVTELEDRKVFVRDARTFPMDMKVDKLLTMFADYESFVKSVIPDYPVEHPAAVHVRTWNDKVTLIHCNTAIGANGVDKTGQVLDVHGLSGLDISKEYPAIILAHNSFFDLHEKHQERVKDFIRANKNNVRAYLCGDRHIGEMKQISYEDAQNKQIPCIVSYKASPDAADKYSSFGIIFGEWENSEAKINGWTWKSGKGFQPDGSMWEKKIEMGGIPADVSSGAVRKQSYQLPKKYDGWLQVDAELEKRKLPDITESMKDFLIGHPCKWSLAFSGRTVRRRQLNELLKKIKAGGINALLGAGAEGKSTLLKQACVQLYYEGYIVLYHVNKNYKLPNKLPDNTVLVIDDPDNDKKFVDFMNYAYSHELPLVIAARRNEWNLFCASRHLTSEIKRAVTKIDMKNITDKREAEAFADCVIDYYRKDADREKLIHIFLRNANDFGFLYAAMLISIYDKSQFEEIAKDIINNIEKNDNKAMKLLACAVLFEHFGTTLSGKEYDEYLNSLKISKGDAKEALELELRHSANRWETRHPQISNLFYEIFFGEDAKLKSYETDEILCYVIEALIKRYNQYYNQRKYTFEYILSSVELIHMSSSSDWLLERIIEEFEEDEDKLRKIRRKLDDSLNVKFGELCYAREIYDAEIMLNWANEVYNISGAGSYEWKNSALWIYRTACLEAKVPGYGIWLKWAKLEAETNGAGSYEKENSALWIYRKSCIEEKTSSYRGWLDWAKLEAETNGAGDYEKENSALWIYRKSCIEETSSYWGWFDWARLEAETNGAGSYEKENSAFWIYRTACLEAKVPGHGIWLEWGKLEAETNGAGDYGKENSALWIYRTACLEAKVSGYGIWLDWGNLEAETNGAGSYEKENSALWIYRRSCIEEKTSSYGGWLEWIRLEAKTNGAGSYKQENSALWICRKACIEEKETFDYIWLEWVKLEAETNGAGSYETENSALWIYREGCLEKEIYAPGLWLGWTKLELDENGAGSYETENSALWIYREGCIKKEIYAQGMWSGWAKLELDENGAGSYETENSALWIYREGCIEKEIRDPGLWTGWVKLELDENGAGSYETENSALWIYREGCIEKEIRDPGLWSGWAKLELDENGAGSYETENSALWIYREGSIEKEIHAPGLWLSWAKLELDENGAGSYETENSALWIYREGCIEKEICDPGLWTSWEKLELDENGAGSYETENSALWIYREACVNRNVLDSVIWANWANLEEETNGAGSYETENSALWIYQEAYHRGYVSGPALWLGWANAVERNMILDSEWTMENIYQQALVETKWELNVAIAYADYLMYQGRFEKSREIYRQLYVQEKYRVLLKLLIIETVAGNIDSDSEFSVSQIIDKIEYKYASNLRMANSLYVYFHLQNEEELANKYYEMNVIPTEEIEMLEQMGEEFMMKCKEVYEDMK